MSQSGDKALDALKLEAVGLKMLHCQLLYRLIVKNVLQLKLSPYLPQSLSVYLPVLDLNLSSLLLILVITCFFLLLLVLHLNCSFFACTIKLLF